MCSWCTPDRNVSEDATQSPHILIFKKTSGTKAIDFDSEYIFSGFNIFGYIEFSSITAIYTVSNLFTVNPEEKSCVYTIESEKQSAALPFCRDLEFSAITSNRIAFFI